MTWVCATYATDAYNPAECRKRLRNAGPKFGFYNTRRRVDYEVGFVLGSNIFPAQRGELV